MQTITESGFVGWDYSEPAQGHITPEEIISSQLGK